MLTINYVADGASVARNIEDETLISTLYEKISQLEGQNSELLKKNKKLVELLEKRKKQVSSMERQLADLKRKSSHTPGAKKSGGPLPDVEIVAARTSLASEVPPRDPDVSYAHSNMAEIARSLKSR